MGRKRIEHVNGEKQCGKCKIYKPLECFGKDKRTWDGLQSKCKDCQKEYSKEWYEKNSEKIKENSKKWNEKNPEKKKEKSKEYYKNNAEEIKERHRVYRQKNSEKQKEYQKEWYEKNSEKQKENQKEWYEKPALFELYTHQLVIDDKPKLASDGIHLLVICKTCYKHFQPTNLQVRNRIQCLNGSILGESNFYCSDICKNTCSIFHKHTHRTGENNNLDREMQPELRILCLERDNHTCQKCGSTEKLHCHHIEGILQNPIESCDIDNTITLCQECHKFVHRLPGCSYHDMQCPM